MVQIRLPDCTFSDRLSFDDEGVSFSYAPGHTIDSAICYDAVDQVLYLGDLVEDPIPYLDAPDLETYLATLQTLIDHPAQILVSAHSGLVSRDLIHSNMAYIRDFRDGVVISPDSFGAYASVHRWNLNMHRIHSFMAGTTGMAEGKGSQLLLIDVLRQAGDLHSCSPEEIQSLLLRIT
jgi:cyclase